VPRAQFQQPEIHACWLLATGCCYWRPAARVGCGLWGLHAATGYCLLQTAQGQPHAALGALVGTGGGATPPPPPPPPHGVCGLRKCGFHRNYTPASAISTRYRVGLGGVAFVPPGAICATQPVGLCSGAGAGSTNGCVVYVRSATLCHITDKPAHPLPLVGVLKMRLRSKIFRGRTWDPKTPFPRCCGARRRPTPTNQPKQARSKAQQSPTRTN
jgi:hypothetical protein